MFDEDADTDEFNRVQELSMLGFGMPDSEAAALEDHLNKDPSDVDSRITLLGYYFTRADELPALKPKKFAHITWMVENQPAHKGSGLVEMGLHRPDELAVYANLKKKWLKQIEDSPQNASILGNAAQFFFLFDKDL